MSGFVRSVGALVALLATTYAALLLLQWAVVTPVPTVTRAAAVGHDEQLKTGRSAGHRLRDEAALLSGGR